MICDCMGKCSRAKALFPFCMPVRRTEGARSASSPRLGEPIQKSRSDLEWQDKVSDGHPNTA